MLVDKEHEGIHLTRSIGMLRTALALGARSIPERILHRIRRCADHDHEQVIATSVL